MNLASTGWLDLVLVVLLVASIAFGFHQGLLRQFFLIVAMYIATVLSAQYHAVLAELILRSFPGSEEMARLIAFVALLAVFSVVITWVIWTAYRETRLPSVAILDNVGGTALGGIIGIFLVSLTLMLVRYSLEAPWPEGSNLRYVLHSGVNNSSLAAVFKSPLPLIHLALRPWLPDGIPLVLDS